MQKLASDFLTNYIFLTVGKVGSSTDLIKQKVEFVKDFDKRQHLKDLLMSQKNGTQGKVCINTLILSVQGLVSFVCRKLRGGFYFMLQHALTIVFAETKRGVDDLEYWLSNNGFPATAIHGDKAQWVSINSYAYVILIPLYSCSGVAFCDFENLLSLFICSLNVMIYFTFIPIL